MKLDSRREQGRVDSSIRVRVHDCDPQHLVSVTLATVVGGQLILWTMLSNLITATPYFHNRWTLFSSTKTNLEGAQAIIKDHTVTYITMDMEILFFLNSPNMFIVPVCAENLSQIVHAFRG